ncbi:hypothetical protein EB837_20440 [Kluyvera ascorbata]|uniref:Uncharacterized protein n=1 Tax=Kluyvera ascorbata TaxID=51288 RepID=A0A3N2RTE6_9ENTR|nr:hypothetical protein EB837_20440 [Kluyvera ascorbata]
MYRRTLRDDIPKTISHVIVTNIFKQVTTVLIPSIKYVLCDLS